MLPLHTGRNVFFLFSFFLFVQNVNGSGLNDNALKIQKPADSSKNSFWKSPTSVAVRSAILPGLGQISNRQYWKVPLFYAAFGACAYFIHQNNSLYQRFRIAYRLRTDNDSFTVDEFDPSPLNTSPAKEGYVYTSDGLLNLREQYRQWRDLTYIIGFGVYAANILDAYVYAELKDFDVSNNLSMKVKPVNFVNIAGQNYLVSTLSLKFR